MDFNAILLSYGLWLIWFETGTMQQVFYTVKNLLSQSDEGEYRNVISNANDCDQPKYWFEVLDVR